MGGSSAHLYGDTCRGCLEYVLVASGVPRHICRSPSHVKADDLRVLSRDQLKTEGREQQQKH